MRIGAAPCDPANTRRRLAFHKAGRWGDTGSFLVDIPTWKIWTRFAAALATGRSRSLPPRAAATILELCFPAHSRPSSAARPVFPAGRQHELGSSILPSVLSRMKAFYGKKRVWILRLKSWEHLRLREAAATERKQKDGWLFFSSKWCASVNVEQWA